MKLYYDKGFDIYLIGEFETLEDAQDEIVNFWGSLGKTIPYMRISDHKDYYVIDFSSHIYFYILYKDKE